MVYGLFVVYKFIEKSFWLYKFDGENAIWGGQIESRHK
jgi:hypothetical protein